MAGILANMIPSASISIGGAVAKTVLQIVAPANQRLLIIKMGFFFEGISVTGKPVLVKLIKQSTGGSGSSAVTPIMIGAGSETLQATGNSGFTSEPTTVSVLDVWEVHPQQGYELIVPLNTPYPVVGGAKAGIVITSDVSNSVFPKFIYEE